MKKQTIKRIYYLSVITSLVTILVCAVIINRTLVNTPEFAYDDISVLAEEPVSAYMAYIDDSGDVTVGIADDKTGDAEAVISFVKNISLGEEVTDKNISKNKIPDAWVVLYDEENRMSDRINFYDAGNLALYNGKCFSVTPDDMRSLVSLCDANIAKSVEAEATKNSKENNLQEQEMIKND